MPRVTVESIDVQDYGSEKTKEFDDLTEEQQTAMMDEVRKLISSVSLEV